MKVQCQCGTKYAFDVTPEMARDPVRFICPGCGLDLSAPINDLIRQELGLAGSAPPAPVPQVAVAAPPPPQSVAAPAAPARLSISRGAATATHGSPVAVGAPVSPTADGQQTCAKHRGELITEHCRICQKPMCPKCMETFGYVCSPLCKARAESNGINVPVYAGQKSVREAKQWRKVGLIGGGITAVVVGLLGFWFWYAWFGSVPHPIFSVRFEDLAYAGGSQQSGQNQFVFLHGGLLARYNLGSKKPVWTNELITKKNVEDAIDRREKELEADIADAVKRGVDSSFRPRVPTRVDLAKQVQEYMERSLHLFVHDQNIWVSRNGKLTRYDWETGAAGQEVTLPNGYRAPKAQANELLFTDENSFGQHVITHISLVSGEARTEEIGEPVKSAVLATTTTTRKPAAAGGKKGAPGAGIPKVPGQDADKPLDPQQVAKDAQSLPYAAKVALPATLSSTMHQEQILKEIKEDEADPNRAASGSMDLNWRSFSESKYGYLQWNSRMVEEHLVAHSAMKAAPARSALENNPSVANSAQVANEILNEMQRNRGGDAVTEDESRYEVVVHRPDAKDVPDWKGEVIGRPGVLQQKTVTVVTGGKMLVVLDKSNKKLWQAELTHPFAGGSGRDEEDDGETTLGEGPCVERDDALYVFDEATLTAFDLATGNVRWRVPSIGIAGVFFDGMGSMYVNSTTADLDSIKYSRQIDITKKTSASVLRIDCKSGNVLWNVQPGGFVSRVDGKFVFCYAAHQAPDLDPDSLTTLPGMADSAMDIRRLNPKNGHTMWDYPQQRAPLYVRFKGNTIELVFRKEVQVLKFLSF